jgi:hypothetical protein
LLPLQFAQECLFANCDKCGRRDTLEHCPLFKWTDAELGQSADDDDEDLAKRIRDIKVSVRRFGYIPVINLATGKPLKNADNKDIKRMGIVTESKSVSEVADYFRRVVLEVMPPHQFRALHQHEKFNAMKDPHRLPQGQCTVVMDFSQNATLLLSREAQSVHWRIPQVSLHIAVVYRHARAFLGDAVDSTPDDPVVVKDIFSFVSDDLTHDTHFVYECQRYMYLEHYAARGMAFTQANEWTDGCAAQYKSSNALGDLGANLEREFGFPVIRHFFETSHAKGEQDGEGGVQKQAARAAVLLEGFVIDEAKSWVEYINDWTKTRQPDPNRKYQNRFCVEIIPDTLRDLRAARKNTTNFNIENLPGKTSPGIRGWHSVRNNPNNPLRIFVRKLSCACVPCMNNDWGHCENALVVDPWVERVVTRLTAGEARQTRSRKKQLSIADYQPETMAEAGTFMAYNMHPGRKTDLAYGLMQLVGDGFKVCAPPLDGDFIKDSYGNERSRGGRYVEGKLLLPIGDGLETEAEFLVPPKRGTKAKQRAEQRERPLRWLLADPAQGGKTMFVVVETLLRAQVAVEIQLEVNRPAQDTSLGKALYLTRCGDAFRGFEDVADGVTLPPAEFLSDHVVESVITAQCFLCAKETPKHSPQCNVCLRTHCYKCEGGKALKKQYPSKASYTCCKECTAGQLVGRDHADAVRVEWKPRLWHAIERHMHLSIMNAKTISRPKEDLPAPEARDGDHDSDDDLLPDW